MKCCICKQEIPAVGDWAHGNDAWPAADGRCCNECDALVVIPARLLEMAARRKQQEVPDDFVVGVTGTCIYAHHPDCLPMGAKFETITDEVTDADQV